MKKKFNREPKEIVAIVLIEFRTKLEMSVEVTSCSERIFDKKKYWCNRLDQR